MAAVKLYLLRLGLTDLYKIGISGKPCSRLDNIASGKFWGQVQIVGVWPGCAGMERNLHRRYAGQRAAPEGVPASGRTEWFKLTREDVQAIRTHCALARMQAEGKAELCRL